VNGVQSGNQYRSIRPNRKEGAAQIGHQTMLMARGVPIRHGEGEAPTCPMYGGSPLFPTATMVTGALGGIPTQNGEARTAAGVIPKASLVKPIPGQRRQLNVAP